MVNLVNQGRRQLHKQPFPLLAGEKRRRTQVAPQQNNLHAHLPEGEQVKPVRGFIRRRIEVRTEH